MQPITATVNKAVLLLLAAAAFISVSGCKSTHPDYDESKFAPLAGADSTSVTNSKTSTNTVFSTNRGHTETVVLREGDVVKLTFPNTSGLNGNHTIDREGNFNLETVGTINAAGKTISQLKDAVLTAAANKIDTKEVTVELVTGTFPVFVTGAVFRPGKVLSDHPITALEACMECGGFDYTRANLKTVKVSRLEDGRYHSFRINLRDVLAGKSGEPFYLRPQDILYVQEKFTWF